MWRSIKTIDADTLSSERRRQAVSSGESGHQTHALSDHAISTIFNRVEMEEEGREQIFLAICIRK